MKRKTYRWLSAVMLIVLLFTEAGNLPVVWAADTEEADIDEGAVEDPSVSENDDADAEVSDNDTVVSVEETADDQDDTRNGDGQMSGSDDAYGEEAAVDGSDVITPEPEDAQTGEVTRLEWWQMLIDAFDMTVEEDNYPDNYYSDLNSSFEYYRDIMVATEFGLVDVEAGDPINVDNDATREFAVHSLNICLGFQLDENPEYTFSEVDSVSYPNDIQVAINKGWIKLNGSLFEPEKAVTSAEMNYMKEYAQNVLKDREFDPDKENAWVFADGVIDITKLTDALMTDVDEYTLSNCNANLEKGKIYGFLVDGYPVVRKFVNIEKTDNEKEYVIKTESVSSEEAFESISISYDKKNLDLKNAVLCDPTMELQYVVGGTIENNYEDGIVYDSFDEVNNKEVSAIIVSQEIDIPPEIKKEFPIELGGGKKAVLACTIGDPFVSHNIDCEKIFNRNQKAFIEVSVPVTFSCNVSLDLLKDSGIKPKVDLAYLPLLGGIGYAKVTLEAEFYGSIMLSYVQMLTVGVSYSSREGFSVYKDFYKESFTIEAKAKASLGIKASIGFDLGVLKGEAYGKFGGEAVAETKFYDDGKSPVNCAQVYAWLYLKYGYKVTFDYWIEKKEWGDEVNVLMRKNSPVKVCLHYEDGVKVPRCTREKAEDGEINKNTNNGKYKYYTPINSRYGMGGGNTGFDDEGNEYTIFETSKNEDDKTCVITKYNGNVSALNIPDELDGYTVVEIGPKTFKDRKELVYVRIPDKVTIISGRAFSGCSNISSVTLPSKLENVGSRAFENCTSLTDIFIPKSWSINAKDYYDGRCFGPFANCSSLNSVEFEEGITEIPFAMFAGCTGLTSITIPNTVTKIGESAFESCENLESINLSNSLTTIGIYAFRKCKNITNFIMPNSVTDVHGYAFTNCTKLSKLVLSTKLENVGSRAFENCTSLTDIYIPKSWSINAKDYHDGRCYGPFANCSSLNSVEFEEGITEIPFAMFAGCTGLTSITIPNTVTKIGESAFESCENLESINLSNSLTTIGIYAFRKCKNITNFIMPNSVTDVHGYAFTNCTKLSKLVLSTKLENVGSRAFENCTSLTDIYIPKSWSINAKDYHDGRCYGPFANCSSLNSVEFEEGITEIPFAMFAGCTGLTGITIPNTVTKIGESAFESCDNLESVVLPDGLKEIDRIAFRSCVKLAEIIIPNSVNSMGEYVFANCTSLKKAVLPNTRKNLMKGTFQKCSNLVEIELPDSLTAIRESAFDGCSSLSTIMIPPSVCEVEKYAFRDCKSLLEIALNPDKSMTVGNDAFRNCETLEKVLLSPAVMSLGNYCFENCGALKDVTIGSGITAIPQYCFANDGSIENIVLPYYVKSIGTNAFANDPKLSAITIPRSTTTIATTAFSYKDRLTIYGVAGTYAETFANTNGFKFVNQEVKATEAKFTEDTYTIYTNATLRLPYSVTPENFTDEMTWVVSKNSDKVSVTDGVVKGLKVTDADDPAVIKLSVGDQLASCKVIVLQSVTSINLNKLSLNMDAGTTYQLTASVYPDSASNKEYTWSSSDENVATVDETGLVTAVAKGSCSITATAADGGGASRSCTVTVLNNAFYPVSVNGLQSEHPYAKDSSDIWIYKSEGASSISVTFSEETKLEEDTDGDYILIKDAQGNEIGKYFGTELAGKTIIIPGDTIWIKLVSDSIDSKDYGFSVTKIEKDVSVVEVTGLTISPETLTLKEGESGTITATLTPSNATNKSIIWSSSDTSVATITGTGLSGSVKAVGVGTATITAKAGEYTATATVTVVDENEPVVDIESITIAPKEITIVSGSTAQLKATITPDSIEAVSVNWSSSDTSVATVTGNGLNAEVNAVSNGSAVITATVGDVSAKATVTVVDEEEDPDYVYVSKITLSHTKVSLMEGKTFSIEADVTPYDADYRDIYWESDNESVATVDWDWEWDTEATVTAVSEGTAIITAYAKDGSGVSASCTITVRKEGSGGPGEAEEGKVYVAAKGKVDAGSVIIASLSSNVATQIKKYTSSNKKIASVTKKGIVKGKKAGTTTITAYIKNGKKYEPVATIELVVTKPVFDFGGATLKDPEEPLYLYDYVKDLPKGTAISWSISKSQSAIAVIDGDEVVATGKSGSVTVTCIIGTGKLAVKYKAKLKAVMPPYIPEETKVKVNKWKTITVYNVPKGKKVKWYWGVTMNEDGSFPVFKMKPSGTKCKVKVKDINSQITIGAEVDGKFYWTKLIIE